MDPPGKRSSEPTSGYQVAELHCRKTGDAVQQRTNSGETHIQLGGPHVFFGRLNGSLCGHDPRIVGLRPGCHRGLGLNFRIQLALRDGAGFGERRVALHVDLRQKEAGPDPAPAFLGLRERPSGLSELSLRLIEDRLKRARIDLEKDVVFVYERTLPIICRIT